ncbi:MAG: flagellar filament capping protein FliD [Spirochaetaceae bacterium]|nr:flagellar filament capping protein FliD [Spirochaetaceae bacterium]
MSDITIPGVSGGYDNYIEALMKVERIPRDNAQKELDVYREKRLAWQSVNRLSNDLRTISNSLYSFNNPFSEKIVSSSEENAITATATREASNASFKIRVDRIAASDSFLSNPIEKNMNVPAGKYTFSVGDKMISFNWKGGNYRNFIETINKQGKDILTVSEIKTSKDSVSLLFKSEVSGAENRLEFEDDALTFALEKGILKKNDTSSVELDKTEFTVEPQSSERIAFSKSVKASEGAVLEITLNKETVTGTRTTAPQETSPIGQDTGAIQTFETLGSVSYQGVTITNEVSSAGLLPYTQSPTTETMSGNGAQTQVPNTQTMQSLDVFSLESTRGVLIPMLPISEVDGEQKIIVDLSEYGDVKALHINNANANVYLDIGHVRVYDPKTTGEYTASQPVSVAQDALINFEGIQIVRPTNSIDDLIPGVTLNLHDKTDSTANVDVKPDNELVKNAIIEFVAKYNSLLTEINILTQKKQEIVDEITYFSQDERDAALERLGIFAGDSTLNSLKNNLRMKVSSAYKAGDDNTIILLSNMGISTNANVGGQIESSLLRGYLEIDEKKLDEAIQNNLGDIKTFFGFDADGDLLVDSGLAFSFYEQLSPYVQRSGIFASKTDSLDTQISSTTKKIAEYDKKLAQKEAQLKQKFSSLEGTLQDLQAQSDTIKNFSKQKGE